MSSPWDMVVIRLSLILGQLREEVESYITGHDCMISRMWVNRRGEANLTHIPDTKWSSSKPS